MTHISELIDEARRGASRWPGCPDEQALVYSCESVASREHPARRLDPVEARALVADICLAQDIDVPTVNLTGASGPPGSASRCIAWADRGGHSVWIVGTNTDTHTVVHEIAHLLSLSDAHDVHFRNPLVHLARTHVGVHYAALLHSLFAGVGLDVPTWTTHTDRAFGPPR